MRHYFLFSFLMALFVILSASNAFACSSPAGVPGEMGYDVTGTGKYQYCDGTNWVDMHDSVSTPVGRWKLDETSGTTAVDSAGSNNGTMGGGLTGGDSTSAILDTGLDFDHTTDDFIKIPHTPALSPTNFTLSAWINVEATTADVAQQIIEKSSDTVGDDTRDFSMNFNQPENSLRCGYLPIAGGIVTTTNINNSIVPGTWYHVACTYDSTTQKLSAYIDGAILSEVDVSANPPDTTNGDIVIGSKHWKGTFEVEHFNGAIDDVRIYNNALSPAEIFGLYMCTREGKMDYDTNSHTFLWCGDNFNASTVSNTLGTGAGNCAASGSKIAGSAGAMQYDTANDKMVYCGGGPNWIDIPN